MSHNFELLIGQLEQLLAQKSTSLNAAKAENSSLQTSLHNQEQANLSLRQQVQELEEKLNKFTQVISNSVQLLDKNSALKVLINESLKEPTAEAAAASSQPEAISTNTTTELDALKPQERLAHWVKTYPQVFMPGMPQPLKIGIHNDLHAQEGGDLKKIHRALAFYVKVPRYLNCLTKGAVRLDLNAQNAGFVEAQEAEFAQQQLEKLAALKKQRSSLNKPLQEKDKPTETNKEKFKKQKTARTQATKPSVASAGAKNHQQQDNNASHEFAHLSAAERMQQKLQALVNKN